jgi:hypothetical protein
MQPYVDANVSANAGIFLNCGPGLLGAFPTRLEQQLFPSRGRSFRTAIADTEVCRQFYGRLGINGGRANAYLIGVRRFEPRAAISDLRIIRQMFDCGIFLSASQGRFLGRLGLEKMREVPIIGAG